MNDEEIADIWMLFKEYLDKKHIEMAAEKYVDLLADYGVDDNTLRELFGHDKYLDSAVNYYLDLDSEYDTVEDDD
jgi:hypothetical protein